MRKKKHKDKCKKKARYGNGDDYDKTNGELGIKTRNRIISRSSNKINSGRERASDIERGKQLEL